MDSRPTVPRAIAALFTGAIIVAAAVALLWPSLSFGDESTIAGPTGVNVITRQIEADGAAGRIGSPAPNFSWVDPEGRRHRLSDLVGNVVVLNFWATWCVPCREEMPALERVARDEPDVVILAVDLDEDGATVRSFFTELGLEELRPLLDVGLQTTRRYGVATLPTTFFVGTDGIIRHIEIGGPMTEETILRGIAKAR
ncbi:MAG: TlpA family protein disulfide reductase [Thermoleophilaceae bacterium]